MQRYEVKRRKKGSFIFPECPVIHFILQMGIKANILAYNTKPICCINGILILQRIVCSYARKV